MITKINKMTSQKKKLNNFHEALSAKVGSCLKKNDRKIQNFGVLRIVN
jgi:hypothetical protein